MKKLALALLLVNLSAYSHAENNAVATNDTETTSGKSNNSGQLVNTCCTRLQDAPLINVTDGKQQAYVFDNSAPAFNFPTGKSFFRAFRLPDNTPNLLIKFSTIVGGGVFMPTIDFYNQNWELVKRLPEDSFSHRAINPVLNDSVFDSKVELKNMADDSDNKPAFMVVYSIEKRAGMTVSLPNPEKQLALANGAVAPDAPDIQLPYATTGTVNIKFTFEKGNIEKLISATESLIGNPTDPSIDMATVNKAKVKTQRQSTGKSDKKPVASQKMYPEVEAFYNKQIRMNVNGGDIDKAWKLATEAAQAGSPTAVDTFMQTLKETQK